MIVRRAIEPRISQCAYLVGCARTRQAILIDPVRNPARYQSMADEAGLSIMSVVETHTPSDYVSGVREVLLSTAARAYLSGETDPPAWFGSDGIDWTPRVTFWFEGDTLAVGDLRVTVLLTPGHAPGGLSLFIEDAVADVRVVATGDALLVGGTGRAEDGAEEQLRDALTRLASLPDDTVVLAGHTSGSACGFSVALPGESTLGIERRFNRALLTVGDAGAFATTTSQRQPERPSYFGRVEKINHGVAPALIHQLAPVSQIGGDVFVQLVSMPGTVVVDTRPWSEFAADGIEGALHAPLDKYFASLIATSFAPDERVIVVCAKGECDAVTDAMRLVGVDAIRAWIDSDVYAQIDQSLLNLTDAEELTQAAVRAMDEQGLVQFIDVRTTSEWLRGRIRGARLVSLSQLPELMGSLSRDKPIIAYCRTGARSARACTYLRRHGFKCATLQGGYWPWFGRGFPVEGADQPL